MNQDSQHTDNRIPEFATRQEEAEFWDSHDFVDFWDAFLWIVAFVFIERNVFEWREETLLSAGDGQITAVS